MKALLILAVLALSIPLALAQEVSVADAARQARCEKTKTCAKQTAAVATVVAPTAAPFAAPTATSPTMWRTHRIGETFDEFAAETQFQA